MKNVLGILALAVLALAFCGWLYMESTYRYRITVPDGRTSTSYYTNAYSQRRGCVYFCNAGDRDSSQVCGTFTVRLLR